LPFALRMLRVQSQSSGIAVSASTRRWLPRLEGCPVVELPSEGTSLASWCQETEPQRRSWALELGFPLDRGSLSGLQWLGGERRIVLGTATRPGVANIELPFTQEQIDQQPEMRRRAACARLGLLLPPLESSTRRGGKSVVFEIPDGVSKGRVARWCTLVSGLAVDHPVVVVHAGDLVPEFSSALQALGNRISMVRIQRAEDVLRLASDVKVWVGRPGPASVIASWVECPLVLFDRHIDPFVGYGPDGTPTPPFAKFLSKRHPSLPELRSVVLDLTPHGM